MADDAVNIDAIEQSKENIQSLPSGRSARALAQVCSSGSADSSTKAPLRPVLTPAQTESDNDKTRNGFEAELANSLDDADDPLDIFDRYVKWTIAAYPSGQGTSASGLLPLLERATRQFVRAPEYANDVRYLRIWLLYIDYFADEPQESFRFLARNQIGASLALFYEEYAGWLETNRRWLQAEQIFLLGLENEARPIDRLRRKFAAFQARADTRAEDGPSSPAIPPDRSALGAKSQPTERDGQTGRQRAPQPPTSTSASSRTTAPKPGRPKMAIFADDDADAGAGSTSSTGPGPHWDSLGSLHGRRKENTTEATGWAGVTLKGGRKPTGPRLQVFRDQVSD